MMRKRFFYQFVWVILIYIGFACSRQKNEGEEKQTLLQPAFTAHGGLSHWKEFRQVSYDVYHNGDFNNHQLIDLNSRKTLISNDKFTLGFNGKEVWVTPDKEAFPGNSLQFYHNLEFYFFALPFVLADPGVRMEAAGQKIFQGKTYDIVNISYEPRTGDSPGDVYVCYLDTKTHQLYLLLYTVTFFGNQPEKKYNARVYEKWQQINGLWVPEKMISYSWEKDHLGEKRGETEIKNVQFDQTPPDESLFATPAGAYTE